MKEHQLKTWEEYMPDIKSGAKTFEIRKNDRHFRKGDKLILNGYDVIHATYTGSVIEADVNYVLYGSETPEIFGLHKDFVIMSITVTDCNF